MGGDVTKRIPPTPLVLVVEVDPDIRELLVFFLTRAGFDVQAVADGRELLQWLERVKGPVIVVSDINPPYVSGGELLTHIRERGLRSVRVVFLTSRTQEKEAVRMLEAGAEDFLRRPFYPRELVARLKKIGERICAGG